ncbi:MAG TPA: BlaI/MecI/CopY family transcriptional regulator [Thermoanaerobaculia bacterium]|nr:BlaI/MecI/CopY family transcriptional regulator [Thermoanaerobaculia bacterium]
MRKVRDHFTRREREMMDIIYRDGRATAIEVLDRMVKPPSYSAVRATLRILEEKGHLRHETDGTRYVYLPIVTRERAQRSALDHLLTTFFNNSASGVVAALLDSPSSVSAQELEELKQMIDQARKEGR